MIGNFDAFLIESDGKNRIGRFVLNNVRFAPDVAFSSRFAEAPQLVDRAEPKGALSVFGTYDAARIVARVLLHPRENEKSAIGRVVDDQGRIGGDRSQFRETAGVFRRKFVEGSRDVEEVAFSRDFTIQTTRHRKIGARRFFRTDRQSIALAAVMRQDAHVVDRAEGRVDGLRVDHRLNTGNSPLLAPFEFTLDAFERRARLVEFVVSFARDLSVLNILGDDGQAIDVGARPHPRGQEG